MRLFLVFFLLLFLSVSLSAVGISPARVEINFTPNLNVSLKFSAINNLDEPVVHLISVKGSLSEYIRPSVKEIELKPLETREFFVDISLPSSIGSFGLHDNRLMILEKRASEGAFSANAAVEAQLWFYVPYPETFIECSLKTPKLFSGYSSNLEIFLKNRGSSEELIQGYIDLFFENGTTFERLYFSEVKLSSQEYKTIFIPWTPLVSPGKYKAILEIKFNDRKERFEKELLVEEFKAYINEIKLENFFSGSSNAVVKLFIEHHMMEEHFENVTSEIIIYSLNGWVVQTSVSNPIILFPLQKKFTENYFDLTSVSPGEYTLEIKLRLNQNYSLYRKINVTVSGGFNLLLFIILLIVVIIIVALVYYFKKPNSPILIKEEPNSFIYKEE